jgi:hypothetical protein
VAISTVFYLLGQFPPPVTRPGRVADQPPPSIAVLKNAWNFYFHSGIHYHVALLN